MVAEGFEKPDYKTRMRTVRLYLDVNQYQVHTSITCYDYKLRSPLNSRQKKLCENSVT